MTFVELIMKIPNYNARTRRDHIAAKISDMIADLLYYDRKEDEDLPVGEIQQAIKSGEITVQDIIDGFAAVLKESLRSVS